MSEVLIVSRTRMRNGVCCGGLNLTNGEFVRLHNERGGNLSVDAPFAIGEVYDISYQTSWNVRPKPHVEDKSIFSYRLVRSLSEKNIIDIVEQMGCVSRGNLSAIFEGKLCYSRYSAYISPASVPSHSVCFWIPDAPLYRVDYLGKTRYSYNNCNFSFVGFQDPVAVIPAGTLLRMSLANWWQPEDSDIEKRCYLQLSGWYGI